MALRFNRSQFKGLDMILRLNHIWYPNSINLVPESVGCLEQYEESDDSLDPVHQQISTTVGDCALARLRSPRPSTA